MSIWFIVLMILLIKIKANGTLSHVALGPNNVMKPPVFFYRTNFIKWHGKTISPLLDSSPNSEQQIVMFAYCLLCLQEEFASALAMKPNTHFVENMFSLMDTDHNGYISFREFLNAVVMLSKGNWSAWEL